MPAAPSVSAAQVRPDLLVNVPFTVESLSPHRVLRAGEERPES
jgi:hypothetical protein